MLQEEVHPTRQVELVLLVPHHDLLEQLVHSLEDLLDADSLGTVYRRLRVLFDEDEGHKEVVDDLDEEFGGASLDEYLLDEWIGGVAG